MKRAPVLVLLMLCATLPAWPQATAPLRLSGMGGFGYSSSSVSSNNQFHSNSHSVSSEIELDSSGYAYDPRLMTYTFSTYWDSNNTGIDQGSAHSRGLSFNGSASLLPQRPFPLTFYYSRNGTNSSGTLFPALDTVNTLWGIRGELKTPKFAWITYNFASGSSANSLPDRENFHTRQRSANITATRKLAGWDLRVGDDFLRTDSSFSHFRDRINMLTADASRSFGSAVHMEFGVSHSSFAFRDYQMNSASDSGVTLANGSLTWKISERVDSFYTFSLGRNAVNTLRLMTAASGSPGITLPMNALSANSSSESFAAGTVFRWTKNLNLNASLDYTHNGLPESTLSTLPASTLNSLTTGVFGLNGGYGYRRKIWKLEYQNSGSLNWQRFAKVKDGGAGGFGFGLDNGISGGNVRRLAFSASYRYARRTNPVFFNIVNNSLHRATFKLETAALGWVDLQLAADLGKSQVEMNGSRLNLSTNSLMLSASFRYFHFYASRGRSDSDERFFGPDSLLFRPGGSTGAILIPAPLLNPQVLAMTSSDRIGLSWHPKRALQVESRYSHNKYRFIFLNDLTNSYWQFDTFVQYKFGRFTILGGYGRAGASALHSENSANRYFFRVRFPFHIL